MKMQNTDVIKQYIMRDMSEGIMAIGFDGIICYLNPAAEKILEQKASSLIGQAFAISFFEYKENDGFNQLILDAVYDRSTAHEGIADYFTGEKTKQLHVRTSFLRNEEEPVGIVCVLSDITELYELRNALKAMKQIESINRQLELRNKLLNETFGRFLSDEIVRQLLETPDGLMLGGKKRSLTVMMSDLRGFTAMSERMEPQKLLDMLNHYLAAMTEIIQKHNGTIIEFIGDGIMAIFGAPVPSEVHADDAAAAAVEMQREMDTINRWNSERSYPVLQMGIGLHTGEVIVGNIGSEKRTKYGVVGSNVNLAGRIESYTVGGQILISPQTRASIRAELTIDGEQEILAKGVKTPITLSSITGIGAPYNLSYTKAQTALQPLKVPVPVSFFRIREKHVSTLPEEGLLTALSETGAILKTAGSLSAYDNLQLEIGGKLYAKVTAIREDACELRFTSLPENFGQWYQSVLPR